MNEPQAVYGIVGHPVKHSLSPCMHNAAFEELGVPATYQLFDIPPDELNSFFEDLKKEGSPIFGLNVTVPYKEEVLAYLDSLAPLAQKIMAVNTIVVGKKRNLIGYNTDAPGFMSHLAELGFNPTDKNVAILGAGGSSRAIIATLCMVPERPQSIILYNRTPERSQALLEDLGQRMDISLIKPVESIDDLGLSETDLLINTTSVGMNDEDCLVEKELLHSQMLVYDLVYNKDTQLLKWAKEVGAETANGLGMLYYQGVLAFQHWADIQLDEKVKLTMRNALEENAGQ